MNNASLLAIHVNTKMHGAFIVAKTETELVFFCDYNSHPELKPISGER